MLGPAADLVYHQRNQEVDKKSSPDGFNLSVDVLANIFEANCALTTTVDGTV